MKKEAEINVKHRERERERERERGRGLKQMGRKDHSEEIKKNLLEATTIEKKNLFSKRRKI